MTELQQNRYDQLLRRVGDLKGPGSKVNNVLADVFPTIDVENIPLELRLLSGSRVCMGTISVAGAVSNFAQAILRMNAGTGMIARVIGVAGGPETDQVLAIGPTQNSFAAGGSRAFVDGRVFGQGTAAVLQAGISLSIGSNFGLISGSSSQIFWHFPPGGLGVITPGNGFSLSTTSSDTNLTAMFVWEERVALPSELSL